MNRTEIQWDHDHDFVELNDKNWRSVSIVFWLTTLVMFVEISAGLWTGSMALLADGWHMGTHSAAFAITLFAYSYAKKHAQNRKFSFGTGKVNYLGSFASAVALGIVALMMIVESAERLINPEQIRFDEAIFVAVIGLLVNVASVFLLHDHSHHHSHDHNREHDHNHDHDNCHHRHAHHDHNLKAAYFHVLADALTSILAIIALIAGKLIGWIWMDAAMGIVGALIISKWSFNLIGESSPVLLDKSPDFISSQKVTNLFMKQFNVTVVDLHFWRLSAGHHAAIISLKGGAQRDLEKYKDFLERNYPRLSHITIEVI